MAELKLKQIREQLRLLSDEELVKEVAASRAALYDMRRKNSMRQLTNTAAIRVSRRQIARALTILRERELTRKKENGS